MRPYLTPPTVPPSGHYDLTLIKDNTTQLTGTAFITSSNISGHIGRRNLSGSINAYTGVISFTLSGPNFQSFILPPESYQGRFFFRRPIIFRADGTYSSLTQRGSWTLILSEFLR